MKYRLLPALLLVLSSCGIYRQNVVNVPLFEQKGQAQLSAHTSFTAYDVQAAFAVTNKLALIANYSDLGLKRENYSTTNYSIEKHNMGEIGLGLYKAKVLKTSVKVREIFIVAGRGMSSRFVTGGDSSHNNSSFFSNNRVVDYSRFMIQLDLGRTYKRFQYAVSPRIFLVNYYHITDNSTTEFYALPKAFIYSDVSFTMRVNLLRYLKVTTQLNATLPLAKIYSYYDFSPFNFSVGLLLNLNLIKTYEKN